MQRLASMARRPTHHNASPPGQTDYQRGLALADRGQWREAAKAFERAIACSPGDSVYWLNLAHARIRFGELDRGGEAALRGASLAPESELALAVAAECLNAGNRHREIVSLIEGRDLERIRDHHVHFQLGEALYHLNFFKEAADRYLAALSRKPDFALAHVQLGNAFNRLHMHEEARECFKTAIAVGGDAVQLTSGMAYEDLLACGWDQLSEDLPTLMRLLADGTSYPQPFQVLAHPSTRRQQLAVARGFAQARFANLEPLPAASPRPASARIRLGYLSSDFHQHATTYLISQILEQHDRSRFEVVAYSYGPNDGSAARHRVEQAVDRFVDAQEMSDRAVAERVQADGVDVLMDLKGYTLAARTGVLAFRPSPVQVNYLGYPGTLGAPFYDYIVGDPTVTPLDHAPDYSEKIAQMPACYQPNDRSRAIGPRPARDGCGLPERGFVFCSFNNPYKITAGIFDVWCRLLHRVENSVLWLYESNAQARRNLAIQAQRRGVAAERLIWAAPVGQPAHLARLQLADLVLDTAPVCAHTTASDALWAGVPLVTCPGETFVSRVAASILQAADLPELAAPDLAGYESLAFELAQDPPRLSELKERVMHNRGRCALFDSVRYTRDFEALLIRMHDRRMRREAPEHLPAESARAD